MVISARGRRIPTEILQVMYVCWTTGSIRFDAVRMPRIFTAAANPVVQVEHGFTPSRREVRAMGYDPVAESAGYARLYFISRRASWVGIADRPATWPAARILRETRHPPDLGPEGIRSRKVCCPGFDGAQPPDDKRYEASQDRRLLPARPFAKG